MQPWLQPMQRMYGLPSRALSGMPGSVIIARVIPQASQSPRSIIAFASAASTIRPAAMTGTVDAAFIRRANGTMALCSIGEGGTIQLEPRYVVDDPRATER